MFKLLFGGVIAACLVLICVLFALAFLLILARLFGLIRFYAMRNCADANVKCCGAWVHWGSLLIGFAPAWWYVDRSRKGRVRVVGVSFLTPARHYDRYALVSLTIGGREYGWRRFRIGQSWRFIHGMRGLASLAIVVTCLLLGACSTPPTPTTQQTAAQAAATISADVLPAADLAKVQALCNQNAALLGVATSPIAPTLISGTAIDLQAYCAQLAAAPQGTVPATTDSNTSSWAPAVLAGVKDAAQIAGFILPLVL